jgi:hypothetical protein
MNFQIEPRNNAQWERVARRYRELSGEANLRDWHKLRDYFDNKMCGMNARSTPTGNPKMARLRVQSRALFEVLHGVMTWRKCRL